MTNPAVKKIGENEYLLELPGEDHTLGSLLQHYLQEDENVATAYYSKPHHLEDKITIYVKLKEDKDPIETFKKALEKIASDARKFREELLKAYEEAGINIED